MWETKCPWEHDKFSTHGYWYSTNTPCIRRVFIYSIYTTTLSNILLIYTQWSKQMCIHFIYYTNYTIISTYTFYKHKPVAKKHKVQISHTLSLSFYTNTIIPRHQSACLVKYTTVFCLAPYLTICIGKLGPQEAVLLHNHSLIRTLYKTRFLSLKQCKNNIV